MTAVERFTQLAPIRRFLRDRLRLVSLAECERMQAQSYRAGWNAGYDAMMEQSDAPNNADVP